MEHLLDSDKFLDEIFRVLVPGGHFILTLPNIASWHCRLQLLLGYQPYAIPISMKHRWSGAFLATQRAKGRKIREHLYINSLGGLDHVLFFTNRGACALVEAHGFNVVKVIGSPYDDLTINLPPIMRRIIKAIDYVAATIPDLASGVIIHATKPE